MKIVTAEYLNDNQYKKYPIDERSSMEPYTTDDVNQVNSLLTDCKIAVPRDLIGSVYISNIVVTDKLVTLTFMGVRGHLFNAINFVAADAVDTDYDALGATAVATVQATIRSLNNKKPVSITPLLDGVSGWVCFGEGVRKPGRWTFTNPTSSKLDDRAVFRRTAAGVTSLGLAGLSSKITGDTLLAGANGLEVVTVGSNTLHLRFSGDPSTVRTALGSYVGACGGRPESDTCAFAPIRQVNGILPDANGVMTFEFDKSLPITVTALDTLSIESPIAIENLCIRTAPPNYDACTSPTAGLVTAQVIPAPMPVASSLTLEAVTTDEVQTSIFSYVSQHPTRTGTAVFVLQSGGLINGETVAELQVDLNTNLWQVYSDPGAKNPSLTLYGGVGQNFGCYKDIPGASIRLGHTLALDGLGSTTVAVDVVTGSETHPAAGTYLRASYGLYVKDDYTLSITSDGASEFWGLSNYNEVTIGSGRLVATDELMGSYAGASVTTGAMTVVSLRKA